jgi:hypothetical protein
MAKSGEGILGVEGSIEDARKRRAAVQAGTLTSRALTEVYEDMDAMEQGMWWKQPHTHFRWLGKMTNQYRVADMGDYHQLWRDELAAREADREEARIKVEEALAGVALQDEEVPVPVYVPEETIPAQPPLEETHRSAA